MWLAAASLMAAEPQDVGSDPLVLEGLQSVLWAQTAVERGVLFRQAYRSAQLLLPTALADPDWNALVEPTDTTGKPPAVILDVDETVLDNAPFHGTMLAAGRSFDPQQFIDWVKAAQAEALPGAVAFAAAAQAAGVEVFFVTNRPAELEPATRLNLLQEGIALSEHRDTLLMRGEHPDWTWDKTSRRALIAADYRVLFIIGDDFNDFVAAARLSMTEREALERRHTQHWGRQWFMLPNPIYGSWLGALYDHQWGLSEAHKRQLRWQRLESFEP